MRVLVVFANPANEDFSDASPAEVRPSTERWRTTDFVNSIAETVQFTPSHDVPLNGYYVDDLKTAISEYEPDVVMLKTHGSDTGDLWLTSGHGVFTRYTPHEVATGLVDALGNSDSVRSFIFHACYSATTAYQLPVKYVSISQLGDPTDDVADAYFRRLFEKLGETSEKPGEHPDWARAHRMAKQHARGFAKDHLEPQRSSSEDFVIVRPPPLPGGTRMPKARRRQDAPSATIARQSVLPIAPVQAPPPAPDPKELVELPSLALVEDGCRNRRRALCVLFGLIALIPFVVEYRWSPKVVDGEKMFGASQVLDFVQAVVVGVVFLLIAFFDKPRPLNRHQENPDLRRAIDQVQNLWIVLWAAWVFLYVAFSFKHLIMSPDPHDPLKHSELENWLHYAAGVVPNIINNIQSVTLFLLFYTMARPTFEDENAKLPAFQMYALCVLVGLVELFFPLLSKDFADNMSAASAVFGLVSGVFAATCFGLFVARIETKFLDTSLGLVMLLCLYSAIQPLFPMFGFEDALAKSGVSTDELGAVTYSLKSFALIGKFTMYIMIYRQMTNGRMAYYMHKIRYYHFKIGADWAAFEAIHFRPQPATLPQNPPD